MSDVKLYRYVLPSVKGEGWAVVVMGSDGYFSTVSDYGNYAYWWSHHGTDDFRKFMLTADADYVRRKLNPEMVLDSRETEKALKQIVLRARRRREIDAYDAREWFDRCYLHNEVDLADWFNNYPGKLPDEYWEAHHTMAAPQVVAFTEKVLPRLKQAIREEMAKETDALHATTG